MGAGTTVFFFLAYFVVFCRRWEFFERVNGVLSLPVQSTDITTKWSQIVFWSVVDETPKEEEIEAEEAEEEAEEMLRSGSWIDADSISNIVRRF